MFKVPEAYRIKQGKMESDSSFGNNGAFLIPPKDAVHHNRGLYIIASDGDGWEHVSMHVEDFGFLPTKERIPYWDEMEFVKELFWDEDDTVVQFHPAKSNYVNVNPNVLHLWRPCDGWDELQMPPLYMV